MRKPKKDELLFLPLGGSNEIGMNVNLYCYKGKWLMIDLGAGFADEYFPGIQMLAPDLSYVYENREDFLGIVLTHAHEDHIGSVGYLWDKLRCPIYATPFTAAMAQNKIRQAGLPEKDVDITIVQSGSSFEVGPFSIQMIPITHSIPEMNAIVLRTEYGNIFHTGDFKFDPDPIIGLPTDEKKLADLGNEGVLAMICDSTGVFTKNHSGSEGSLRKPISELVSEAKGMVVVTTFASNVARIETISKIARENGRKVLLSGLSCFRVTTMAKDTGYLSDIEPFITDKEMSKYPRDKLLVICTGCQGEDNAAMAKIASGNHQSIRLSPKDTVIFSSKVIPGNEKKIFALFNKFIKLGCEVFTEKDHFVHVSGHPSRDELIHMYNLIKPQMVIPVHGEPMHLHEHVKIVKSLGIKKHIEISDGEIVKLAPGEVQSIGMVKSGALAVDGSILHPQEGEVMNMRRKLQREGMIFITLVMNINGNLAAEPVIHTPGVIDAREYRKFLREVSEELIDIIGAQNDTSDDHIYKSTRKTVLRMFMDEIGKRPPVDIHIVRV